MQVPKGFIFAYALILGILYLILGFLELTEGFSIMFLPPDYHVDLLGSFIPGDLFGGFSTIVVGLVLIRSLLLSRKKYDALMYVLVGSALAVIFGVLYVLIGGANGLSAYMAGEKWIWTEDVFRFEVLLLPFSILLVPTSWSVIKNMMKGSD